MSRASKEVCTSTFLCPRSLIRCSTSRSSGAPKLRLITPSRSSRLVTACSASVVSAPTLMSLSLKASSRVLASSASFSIRYVAVLSIGRARRLRVASTSDSFSTLGWIEAGMEISPFSASSSWFNCDASKEPRDVSISSPVWSKASKSALSEESSS